MAKENNLLLTSQYLGREGTYYLPNFIKKASTVGIRIVVIGVRKSYGRLDFNIAPVAGTGTMWISSTNVNLDERTEPSVAAKLAAYLRPKKT